MARGLWLPSAPFEASWTSYKKGLVDSGKSCGVLVVSPLIALMHAYAGVFTQTSSVKPNPFANVTIKIDVIFTFKLNACANSVYQAFPPRLKAWVRGSDQYKYLPMRCFHTLQFPSVHVKTTQLPHNQGG